MPITSPFFTWSNGKSGTHRIEHKLDHAFYNFNCLEQWYNYRFLINGLYHNPLSVSFSSASSFVGLHLLHFNSLRCGCSIQIL